MPPTASVNALVDFYFQTGGPTTWIHTDNWLVGEPCENAWFGVVCCPLAFPFVDRDGYCYDDKNKRASAAAFDPPDPLPGGKIGQFLEDDDVVAGGTEVGTRRSLQSSEVAPPPPPFIPSMGIWPNGCRSGSSTGNSTTDRTKCRVAALMLASNNLTGTLEVTSTATEKRNVLCPLHHLQVLSLGDNDLSGSIPDDVKVNEESMGPGLMQTWYWRERPDTFTPTEPLECLKMLRHIDVEVRRTNHRHRT